MLDSFRIKPDEFSKPAEFYVQSVKLTAFEQADASYTIRWNYSNREPAAPSCSFLGHDGTGFNGTQICVGRNPHNRNL